MFAFTSTGLVIVVAPILAICFQEHGRMFMAICALAVAVFLIMFVYGAISFFTAEKLSSEWERKIASGEISKRDPEYLKYLHKIWGRIESDSW